MTLNDVELARAVFLAGLPTGDKGERIPGHTRWEDLGPHAQERYRRMAEAAIKALLQNVTRVDLIPPRDYRDRGQRREHWADSWEMLVQDEGRTLKLFAKGAGTQHRAARDAALGADVRRLLAE